MRITSSMPEAKQASSFACCGVPSVQGRPSVGEARVTQRVTRPTLLMRLPPESSRKASSYRAFVSSNRHGDRAISMRIVREAIRRHLRSSLPSIESARGETFTSKLLCSTSRTKYTGEDDACLLAIGQSGGEA